MVRTAVSLILVVLAARLIAGVVPVGPAFPGTLAWSLWLGSGTFAVWAGLKG
jgi:hypothetical protein